MAASGIAEHNEARRREVPYLRKAYEMVYKDQGRQKKIAQNEYEKACGKYMGENSYERKQPQDSSRYDAEAVDRSRRQAHLARSRQEYSAKLPNRFTSGDYISQW